MSADEFYRDLPESVVPLLDTVPLGQESWVAECEAIENDETLSLTERLRRRCGACALGSAFADLDCQSRTPSPSTLEIGCFGLDTNLEVS